MTLEAVGIAFMWLIFGLVALVAVGIVIGVATSIRHQRRIELLRAEAAARRPSEHLEGHSK